LFLNSLVQRFIKKDSIYRDKYSKLSLHFFMNFPTLFLSIIAFFDRIPCFQDAIFWRCFPSFVFAPVESPPCKEQRPFFIARRLQSL
jgi:hypothetical protein